MKEEAPPVEDRTVSEGFAAEESQTGEKDVLAEETGADELLEEKRELESQLHLIESIDSTAQPKTLPEIIKKEENEPMEAAVPADQQEGNFSITVLLFPRV